MLSTTKIYTGVERSFSDDEFIITKTNSKGIITYANQIVMNISDYTVYELLGSPHNIFRHKDMPKCIFKFLWDNIKQGDEVLAYVINRTKNGDYYWVFAHVTASFDSNGNVVGYLSCRRSPEKEAIEKVKVLYAQLIEEEGKHSDFRDGMDASLKLLIDTIEAQGMSYTEFVLSL